MSEEKENIKLIENSQKKQPHTDLNSALREQTQISPIKQEIIVRVSDELKLEGLTIKESELEEFLNKYISAIDSRLLNSTYEIKQLITKQSFGYERHYFKIMKSGQIEGVAFFNIDHTDSNDWRVFIRHISLKDISLLEKAIRLVVEYIWKYVYCSNIRVEIFHIKDQQTGQMKVDPDIKTAYTNCGFKWKTLTNDPHTGKRAQIM